MGKFCVCIAPLKSAPFHPDGSASDLLEFAVTPCYQSQGFGKALLMYVIAQAQEQGLNIAVTASAGRSPTPFPNITSYLLCSSILPY